MALTLPRWIALLLAGGLLTVVAIMREPAPRAGNVAAEAPTALRVRTLQSQAGQAATRLRVTMLGDSVRQAVGGRPLGEYRYVLSPALAPERKVIERVVETLPPGRTQSGIPVDVVFLHDTGAVVRGIPATFGGRMTLTYLLPEHEAGGRCVVMVRMRPIRLTAAQRGGDYARLLSEDIRKRLLGPCAYYAAFGHPGPEIRRWLDRQDWTVALYGDWSSAYPEWESPFRSRRLIDQVFGPGFSYGLRSGAAPETFRCAAGDVEECRQVMLAGAAPTTQLLRTTNAWGNVVAPNVFFSDRGWFWRRYTTFGPRGETILAEMARTLGPDRFRAFWQSREHPAGAFQAATAQDIGAWTQEWAERMYGPQQRGPAPPAHSALWSLAFVGLTLGGAIAAASRRRVA